MPLFVKIAPDLDAEQVVLIAATLQRAGVPTAAYHAGLDDVKRRIAITLPHVVAVPFAVSGTDLVATMAERVARRFAASAGVAVAPLPCRRGLSGGAPGQARTEATQ